MGPNRFVPAAVVYCVPDLCRRTFAIAPAPDMWPCDPVLLCSQATTYMWYWYLFPSETSETQSEGNCPAMSMVGTVSEVGVAG